MQERRYKAIGMMSGTSLDGLDLAYCEYQKKADSWEFDLLESKFIPYTAKRKSELAQLVHAKSEELLKAHHAFGHWLGKQVHEWIDEKSLEVELIASHGHTVFHQPLHKFTFQLGDGHDIAQACGIKTIADFRSKDVASGGQGAPLVPIGDQLLFSGYDLCLNLGGIANVSLTKNGHRMAGDIAPANMLLNYITAKIGKSYDADGNLARTGSIHSELLEELNALNYYTTSFPKSTGYEWFASNIVPIVDRTDISVPDLLRTSIEHTAFQVAKTISHEKPELNNRQMLVTGGGAQNHFMIERLSATLRKAVKVVVPEIAIVNFKEAIVFGLMGVLRLRNEPNCLSSVTGASHDVSGGIIYESPVDQS